MALVYLTNIQWKRNFKLKLCLNLYNTPLKSSSWQQFQDLAFSSDAHRYGFYLMLIPSVYNYGRPFLKILTITPSPPLFTFSIPVWWLRPDDGDDHHLGHDHDRHLRLLAEADGTTKLWSECEWMFQHFFFSFSFFFLWSLLLCLFLKGGGELGLWQCGTDSNVHLFFKRLFLWTSIGITSKELKVYFRIIKSPTIIIITDLMSAKHNFLSLWVLLDGLS